MIIGYSILFRRDIILSIIILLSQVFSVISSINIRKPAIKVEAALKLYKISIEINPMLIYLPIFELSNRDIPANKKIELVSK